MLFKITMIGNTTNKSRIYLHMWDFFLNLCAGIRKPKIGNLK